MASIPDHDALVAAGSLVSIMMGDTSRVDYV
jgi:hypothetical protein